MRVTGKVTGLDPLKKKIAVFPKEVQRPMDKLLVQEVRTLAVESARITLPFGLTDKPFKQLAARHSARRAQAPCTYYANEKCVSLPQCGQWEWQRQWHQQEQ